MFESQFFSGINISDYSCAFSQQDNKFLILFIDSPTPNIDKELICWYLTSLSFKPNCEKFPGLIMDIRDNPSLCRCWCDLNSSRNESRSYNELTVQ